MSKKPREHGGTVREGRQEDYSENESINVDFNSKLYYIYREVILLLLISFSQDEVSDFLFKMDKNKSLIRFFDKVGSISITEFDKVVWFLVNSQYYVSTGLNSIFFKEYEKYKSGFLKSSVFNIIQASKSFSIIICRFLYTIIKTNQTSKGQGGGMLRTSSSGKRLRESDEIDISELADIIENPSEYIVDNCETIEEVLGEPYLNLDNIDPTPEDFSDNPPPPPVAEDDRNESKIGINKQPIRIRDKLYERVLNYLNPHKDILVSDPAAAPAPAPATTEPEKRKCSRFVLLAEAKLREQEIKLNEENKKKEIALQLAIKAKQELDEAISKAGGETYRGIITIAGTFYPKDESERIDIADSKLIPILAMKQKSIEQGVREMLMNNNIPNKVSAVSILAKLNIISASADINDDDDDNQGGGGHSNYNQYGNGGPNIPKTKKHRLKDSDNGNKVKVADVRELLEGIGAQNQCNAAIGSIKDIPRIKCYICGQLGGMPNMKTMECEHIFCVGLAAQYFGFLRATSFSEEQKLVLSILYAWAHRCCNQLKSNLSFMKFKSKPNENEFEFHEANAKELLRNIYGNTEKYDCEWVDKLIKKVYTDKQRFITARTAILGRYCKPLIEQINEVRTRLFHFSPDLFSFMSILKIAATTLVLLTGEKNEPQLKLKSKETVPLCRLLLFKDLESKLIAKGRGRGRGRGRGGGHNGGGRKNNKIQYGGVFDNIKDSLTIEDIYNGCWGELMKFMIHTESMRPELPEEQIRPADEAVGSRFARFIIHYDDNHSVTLDVTDTPISCNNERLVEVVNEILFGNDLPELPPYGQFYIVHPITNARVLIQGSLGDTIGHINGHPEGVPEGVPEGTPVKPIISSEDVVKINYSPTHNGPGADKKETPETLNIHIFNLLALNHNINPYSLIVALLYDNVSDEEHIHRMIHSINVISGGFHITDEYKREHLSVTLLIMLLDKPTTPLPPQLITLFETQTAILHRIKDKLLVDTSLRFESLIPALNAILLIVHPDELPDDDSKDNELIQDILSFIHCENKNRLYIDLITTLGIADVGIFKPPEQLVELRTHDGKLDEADDGESVQHGIVPMEESDIVDLATRKNRIRNLLLVIGGVYLADNKLDVLNHMMHQIMNSETSKFPNFSEKFEDFAQVPWVEVPHIFVYLINLLIEEPESILILNIFRDFLVEKFILFKPESPKRPMSVDDNPDSPPYDSTSSPRSDSTSSQPLSPSSNPAPHTDMTEESTAKIIESSLSLISSYSGTCVFDSTDLQTYIDYFNHIVIEDGYQVILRINNQYNQQMINVLFRIVIVPDSRGGRKTNKKKLTKRRTVQRRHDKQNSKKKRNTSSNKGKKRVSIKHKKSRTKYHDTRKRRK